MPETTLTPTPLLDNWLRKQRAERFEPDPTPEEIAAQNLEPHVVGGITFWWAPPITNEVICPACAAGHHEQPALGPCDCICHGQATARKPVDYQRRFLDAVEASTLPLRTRRAA